ncbi:MAG: hypothetical protein P1P78_11290 [Methyloprofundus sp.]|nr:hypothetical protein [Methyloprofundus sp.]
MTDSHWIQQRKPDASEKQIAAFCERVALFEACGQPLNYARSLALEAVNHDYA